MILLQGKIPRKVALAYSGGVDSVACYDFLKRNHVVQRIFVNHKTENSHKAMLNFGYPNDIIVHDICPRKPSYKSWEEHWRDERYNIFHSYNMPVITCHHLDDCVETWIWSSMHGNPKVIPYRSNNVIRPFLRTKKSKFYEWASRNSLKWTEDQSNKDNKHMRNYIRNVMMPHVLRVNPGIQSVVKRKVEEQYDEKFD